MDYFTSITANYLPKARTLAKSVKQHVPGSRFHLMLSDDLPASVDPAAEPFDSIISLEDLALPYLDAWIFKHTVVELCTAVKGAAFLQIIEQHNAEKVVYLDPDILVLADLAPLSVMLDSHSVLLTPHQVVPETEPGAILDNEICSLKHGIYNIGFLAVRADDEGLRFLRWWRDRLLDYCYDDIPNGLFTDQRWVDLAPAFFQGVHIVRDKPYNVATWNLTHRHVERGPDGRLVVDGEPVRFYHFSGFDSGDQGIMLSKYAPAGSPLFELRRAYIQQMSDEGQETFGALPCKFSCFSNGEPIRREHRVLYRLREDLQKAFPHPSVVQDDQACYYDWFEKTRPQELEAVEGYQEEVGDDPDVAVSMLMAEIRSIQNSRSYKLGRALTRPYRALRRCLGRSKP